MEIGEAIVEYKCIWVFTWKDQRKPRTSFEPEFKSDSTEIKVRRATAEITGQ
jgi:hypothetical protein